MHSVPHAQLLGRIVRLTRLRVESYRCGFAVHIAVDSGRRRNRFRRLSLWSALFATEQIPEILRRIRGISLQHFACCCRLCCARLNGSVPMVSEDAPWQVAGGRCTGALTMTILAVSARSSALLLNYRPSSNQNRLGAALPIMP